MEWERDAAKDSLMILLISLLILSLAGALVGWEVFRDTPKEVSGKSVSGLVSLCVDEAPTLVLNDWQASVGYLFTHNVSKNITTNPEGLPIYYYIDYDEVPNPNFTINWSTGIINFTPNSSDVGIHLVTICVTHDICTDVEDCEDTNFTITDSNPPVWHTPVPDFQANETDVEDLEPDLILNLNNSNYVKNISFFPDYVSEPDNESMTFSAFGVGENLNINFPAFNLDSSSGVAEIIDPDDVDVGVHFIRVRARDPVGSYNFSNTFSIEVLNSIEDAPIIQPIPYQYICEDYLYQYQVEATDPDPDEDVDSYNAQTAWGTFSMFTDTGLIRFRPSQSDIGNHSAEIYANDDEDNLTASTSFNSTVMEINDYPKFTFSSLLLPNGTQTYNYYVDLNATDEEDIDESSGNLQITCNISWINNSMDHTTGIINTTIPLNVSGTLNVKLCVRDTAISVHPNAEDECGETGDSKQTCNNTFIYIGNNTPPQITNWTPENLSITIRETQSSRFEIEYIDYDNSSLHVYWLVDGSQSKYTLVNSSYPPNKYIFGTNYQSSGIHEIEAVVSDGVFEDSITWEVTVIDVQEVGSGGGGGGGAQPPCEELWTCPKWTACQKLTDDITYPIRGDILEDCKEEDVPLERCGYKTRICKDENNCATYFDKPEEIKGCYFSPNPNCYDGIKNCHHGSCEILPDCGGPCETCPTCSDGLMNQGEKGIDCGGPCMPCTPEKAAPPECGNKVCSMDELFSCTSDCFIVWATVIIILTTLLGFKVGLVEINKLKSKRIHTDNLQEIKSLAKAIEEAIDTKDIVLAKELYSKSRKIFKELTPKEKLKLYPKLAKSLKKLKEYNGK